MSSDRRDFFKTVAGAAATLASVEAVLDATDTTATADAAAAAKRAFGGGHFALEVERTTAGFLRSVEGGDATADVVEETLEEGSCSARKHLGNVRYEDIAISFGTGMSADFYAWLQGVLGCQAPRKNGAIVAADFNFNEVSRHTFMNALITELGLPALDASSKDAALMTVTFSPESTQRQKGSGKAIVFCGGGKVQKKWLSSNFRLTIDGLDCKNVSKIDALVVKQKVTENPIGDSRDYGREPGKLEIPNLVVTLAEVHAQSFFDWHEDFVIKGNNGPEAEKSGRLEYLTPNLAEVLFTINFENLGIFKLVPEKVEASSDQIRRVRAEMYCEQMTFSAGKGAIGC